MRRTSCITVAVLAGTVSLPASAAAATPTCFGVEATIVGTEGHDELHGTPLRDVIVGLGAGDEIYGGGGDDLLCGYGEGVSSSARDRRDELYGGPGNDKLDGGKTADYAAGGTGRDVLVAGGTGGIFGDALEGGPGDDVLRGSGAGEYLDPGGGDDVVTGGPGDDTLDLMSARRGLHVSIARGTALGEGRDRFTSVERVYGSDHDDVLLGSAGNDSLEGGGGDDVLRGGGGSDYLDVDRLDYASMTDAGGGKDVATGGPGNDGLSAGDGNDRLDGGAGRDAFSFYGGGRDVVDARREPGQLLQFFQGPVEIDLQEGEATIGGASPGTVSFDHIQDVYGSPQSDELIGDGRPNLLNGTPSTYNIESGVPAGGDDTIRGLGGDDRISEADGDSSLYGGPGDDEIRAVAGADAVWGGKGNDTIEAGPPDPYEFGDDDDVSGGPGSDVIAGGIGADELSGDAGDDEIEGGPDDDRLDGGAGTDDLDGGAGTDVCSEGETTQRCEGESPLPVARASRGTSSARTWSGSPRPSPSSSPSATPPAP